MLGLILLGGAWDLWSAVRSPAVPPVTAARAARDLGGPGAGVPDAPADSPAARSGSGAADPAGGSADSLPPMALPVRVISLNRATGPELESLPGIGPVLAGRILEHRSRHGPFRSVDELRAVRGVGPRLLERLRGRVSAAP